MPHIVIDTNVLLVADGKAQHMTNKCRIMCLDRLDQAKKSERIVIDDAWLILGEYHNKLSPNKSPTYGSAFLKWLLQVSGDERHVSRVTITPLNNDRTLFAEFPPDKDLEAEFDPADRKFVAVANKHPQKPTIIECADSKWLGWESKLKKLGINLQIICRCELIAIRAKKTK